MFLSSVGEVCCHVNADSVCQAGGSLWFLVMMVLSRITLLLNLFPKLN